MDYWVVWRSKCHNGDNYVHGVYIDEDIALNECNKNNKLVYEDYEDMTKDDINIIDNDILDYTENLDDILVCSKIIYDENIYELYFICIIELGEAGSYGNGEQWIHICSDKQNCINLAIDYFNDEHDRNNRCDECINGECKKELFDNLKNYNKIEIRCYDSYCPYTNFEIFSIKISK